MKIGFYVDCTPTSGLGHIYRSIGLARIFEERGHRVVIATTSNFGNNILTTMTKSMSIVAKEGLTHYAMRADWLIVDKVTATKKPPYRHPTKFCFVGAQGADTDGTLNIYDIIVCGGIPFDKSRVDSRWLTGFDYAMLWPELPHFNNKIRKKKVFLYKSIYAKDAKIIKLEERLREKYIVDPPNIVSQPMRLDYWAASSCVVVSPFGMTTLEAAYWGIPSICFNMNPYAQNSCDRASELGATYSIAFDDNFVDNVIEKVDLLVDSFDMKTKLYTDMSNNAKKLVDGNGSTRIANIIEGWGRN
jgi:spore coat polysaccharide biosynthesis predicted glycosyltransferase SpsG